MALARAWLTQRPYLLLDDALSAVDAKTATRILQNLQSATHATTLLMVTHRLQGLEKADQIIVLEQENSRSRDRITPCWKKMAGMPGHGAINNWNRL